MRWDPTILNAATFKLSTTEPTKKVKVEINYDDAITKKHYKIVEKDGKESEWLEYKDPITVVKNETVIYAKGETDTEISSEISSIKIGNVDEENPDIKVNGDFETPTKRLTIQLVGIDNIAVDEVGYAKGEKTSEYFEENGNFIDNNGTFTVEENGKYTVYVKDKVGNTTLKVIEVKNIDSEAPDIKIDVLTKSYSDKAEVEIDYGDSTTKQYKVGVNGVYKTYTERITINSLDVLDLANSDGTITIYAKGTDSAGNEDIVSEKIYVLDLDVPNAPVINTSNKYPLFTQNGITTYSITNIVYDDRDDIYNYYSVDNGKNWNLYTGSFKTYSLNIMAKSVKKESGLEVESNQKITVPSNVLGVNAYDGNTSTYFSNPGALNTEYPYNIKIEDAMKGQNFRLILSTASATSGWAF